MSTSFTTVACVQTNLINFSWGTTANGVEKQILNNIPFYNKMYYIENNN